MSDRKIKQDQRLTQRQKNAEDKKWYKEQADRLDVEHLSYGKTYGDISDYKRMKVNYDLYNNILDLADFEYVCQPFGAEEGELPAQMVNRDIVSGKIKALLGMEMKRPFSWRALAVNPEATTRKEQAHFGRVRDYVVSSIMTPIQQQLELEYKEKFDGPLSQEQQAQVQEEVAQRMQSMTPEEVKKYMEREHQDPAEIQSDRLLRYLSEKCDLREKFNEAFKHMLISAKGILHVGIYNGHPEVWNVNSLRFNCEESPDLKFVEDAEYATCEYRMSPSDVVKYFDLSEKEIDDLYADYQAYSTDTIRDQVFNFSDYESEEDANTIKVLHCVWKSLRKIGFLTYIDENGEPQQVFVDESYPEDEVAGDISIEWEWIPEAYETWKIGTDMYKKMRPIPGQFKDINNLHQCKLPYYGAICDNLNSQKTSIMDRLKVYQYYFNIIMYRIELLMASDKGKKVLMNINAIPDKAGLSMEEFQYYIESGPFGWVDPTAEGISYNDFNQIAKEIDLSLASDIAKYVELAEYMRKQAGESVGLPDGVLGGIEARESVTGSQQNLIQVSHILEPYFDLHMHVKKNVMQALIETAKIAYANNPPESFAYVLDDMSQEMFNLDMNLLDNSTIGVFVSNSAKAEEIKEHMRQLAHAALQNQRVELSDVISVLRQEGVAEAEETLKVAEGDRREAEQSLQREQLAAEQQRAEQEMQFKREEMAHELDKIKLQEEERRKTEIIKNAILGMSYNPDTDNDGDGVPDFFEIAKHGLDAEIKRGKNQLDREKLEHQKQIDKEKLKLEEKKIKIAANKPKTSQ